MRDKGEKVLENMKKRYAGATSLVPRRFLIEKNGSIQSYIQISCRLSKRARVLAEEGGNGATGGLAENTFKMAHEKLTSELKDVQE